MKLKNIYNYPNLPLPDLNQVMERFKKWSQPLLTKEQFDESAIIINQYLNSDDAKKIHQLLLEKAKDIDSSWIIDWWIKYMYLVTRGPVTPEVNAVFVFRNNHLKEYELSEIVSIFIHKISEIYLQVFNHKDKIIDNQLNPKKKFSLDQLIYMFSSFRVMNHNFDDYYLSEHLNDFIVVLKNNIIYKLKVIDNQKQLISLDKINSAIKYIIDDNQSLDVNLNFITSACDREKAKVMIDKLTLDEQNKEAFDCLKDAIVAISLDNQELDNPVSIFKNFLSGDKFNRLHGKCLLINFNKNKQVSFAVDHTMVDGGTEIFLFTKIYEYFDSLPEFNKHLEANNELVSIIKTNLTSQQNDELNGLYQEFIDYINKVEIKVNVIKQLNRMVCKQLNILSPDGFIQLLFQLAQYKTDHQLKNIYCAVDVRNFFRGRTECIRPISNESKQFVIDFIDNNLNDKDVILERLKPIFDEHYNRAKACQSGDGVNRYLFGIKMIYEENKGLFKQKPLILDCAAYQAIGYNFLSTSSITAPFAEWVYFDPVVSNGLGIFYAMDENDFRYTISSDKQNHQYFEQFCSNLETICQKMLEILSK